jgi:HEPN domain-containing protein
MDNNTENPNAWTFFADKDLLAAETLAVNAKLSGETIFHCQQAVEKYLKAFLAKNKISIKKTHDLIDLYSEAKKIKIMNLDLDLLKDLRDLYVETRYPSNIGTFEEGSLPSAEDVKIYLDFAESVAKIVKAGLEDLQEEKIESAKDTL